MAIPWVNKSFINNSHLRFRGGTDGEIGEQDNFSLFYPNLNYLTHLSYTSILDGMIFL